MGVAYNNNKNISLELLPPALRAVKVNFMELSMLFALAVASPRLRLERIL